MGPNRAMLHELFDRERLAYCTDIVDQFRATYQRPLGTTSMGLRTFMNTALGKPPVVSQRLKRLPRIVRKLANMESSMLARLEDVGGTRAVVSSLHDQRLLGQHLVSRWSKDLRRDPRDYVDEPKPTGYRAVHYVVEKHGRRIEIQIRTRRQQQWANAVEQADSRFGLTLKDGRGPQSMLDYFTAVGDMLYYQDAELSIPADVLLRFETMSDAVIDEGFYVRRKDT
ncbi:RelA/SpoT domain-containing protein [Microbacterium sp. A93]|uniref:RelA/SpoT domain-containing protein n=1 Tax=Microbacterium sp. A93 TaxID=3450716 RepID=UPI003F430378